MKEEEKERKLSFLALILCILELLFLFIIHKNYKGIYEIEIFIPALLVLFAFFIRLALRKVSVEKKRFIILFTIILLLPIVLYLSLPKYTYSQAKELINKKLSNKKDSQFVETESTTIDIANKKKKFFLRQKEYYFAVLIDGEDKEFRVDPCTGEVNTIID